MKSSSGLASDLSLAGNLLKPVFLLVLALKMDLFLASNLSSDGGVIQNYFLALGLKCRSGLASDFSQGMRNPTNVFESPLLQNSIKCGILRKAAPADLQRVRNSPKPFECQLLQNSIK